MRLALLAVMCYSPVLAQDTLRALAAKIDESARLETPMLGLDTRVRAAQRLRVQAPEVARQLLDHAMPAVQGSRDPGYAGYRLFKQYAVIDPDVARKHADALASRTWAYSAAYSALIDEATDRRDLVRAASLARGILASGEFRHGGIRETLRAIQRDNPAMAAELLKEVVAAFPVEKAAPRHVITLFQYLAEVPDVAFAVAHLATKKAFEAMARPDFRADDEQSEQTAVFKPGSFTSVETASSYETALFEAAAYLAVFDPVGWLKHVETLPAWKVSLYGLRRSALPGLIRSARYVGRAKPPRTPAGKPPDYFKMTFEQAREAMRSLPDEQRAWATRVLPYRRDITAEQRETAVAELLEDLPKARMQFDLARILFFDALNGKLEIPIPTMAEAYLSAARASAASENAYERAAFDRGEAHDAFLRVTDAVDKGKLTLARPDPSIESRRLLKLLDAEVLRTVDFKLPDTKGEERRLTDLRGRIVVLDFWATWCVPCREAIPALDKISREFGSKGVVVLGVDDEPVETIRKFMVRSDLSYETLLDPDRKVHDLFGVEGIPTTIIFDRAGNPVERVPLPHSEERLRAAIKRAGVD